MANEMKKVDAVIVGFGWAGAIMAKELTEAGLNVLALERGPHRAARLPARRSRYGSRVRSRAA